ncbi:trehalase-like isoform X1 [Rhynchophorus ferrugineus]|uniref:trehalase-like isoform X1 n=2 Tax=Rhynchophorus ferrugineus TaxID=354439 RepID=UPI003FCD06D2
MSETILKFLLVTVVTFMVVSAKPLQNNKQTNNTVVPTCDSKIYCQGDLLDTIQLSGIYSDSKTFVDMSMIYSVNETLKNFSNLMNQTNNEPTQDDLMQFISTNFVSANETVSWTPSDYNPNPSFLNKITDDEVRTFAQNLVAIWPTLGRKVSDDVINDPTKHSIIPIPNGFIIPGGRFRESYYWDSYWIIRGLLISGMSETAKGMLENFVYLINQYGFIPNGARVYYLNRSQPPLFTLMVSMYIEYTNDTNILTSIVPYIEQELSWWLENRTITVKKHGREYRLAHYQSLSNTPRSESYKEDYTTCSYYTDSNDQQICYQSLKSGAETGWDFSSRWFFDDQGGTSTNLTHIRTQRVVPVDLNSFLYKAFQSLSDFYRYLGDKRKENQWASLSNDWLQSIEEVLYNQEDGIWYDYDSILEKPRKYFFPSNFAPLWADAYNQRHKNIYGKRAAQYFTNVNITQYLGGIPTSLDQSGEQWDFSNAWPPLQELVVLGLMKSENEEALQIAHLFGSRWISANIKGYNDSQIMYEKYDAVIPGAFGGGGEYTVQAGFGWTNGVALHFIKLFYSSDE